MEIDDAIRAAARAARARGLDIELPELSRRWLRYLASLVRDGGLMDGELEYMESLYEELDTRSYLDGESRRSTRPELLESLLDWVGGLDTSKFEAAIAAVFICHQIAGEMAFKLLGIQRLIVNLRLGSTYRIRHPRMDESSLHAICNAIEASVDLPTRPQFLASARNLNASRNRVAHSLLESESLDDVHAQCRTFEEHFTSFQEAFDNAFEEACDAVKTFGKWSDMFENDYEGLLLLRLDDEGVSHLSRDEFARREGLVIE